MNPVLAPCFRFLAVKGLERIGTVMNLLAEGPEPLQEKDRFCGYSGRFRYCYTLCPSLGGGKIQRRSTDLACLVYDNGLPDDPNPTNLEVETIFLPFIAPSTTNTETTCGNVLLVNEKKRTYCLSNCEVYQPVTRNPNPSPCFFLYEGSWWESMLSSLTFSLDFYLSGQQDRAEENLFCPFSSLNQNRDECTDNILRLCQPNSEGVIWLPPGESKCLVYLNGPAAGVGVLAATALGGITTTSISFLGTGGALTLGTTGALMGGFCPPPLFCRTRVGCCRIVATTTGLRCPVNW